MLIWCRLDADLMFNIVCFIVEINEDQWEITKTCLIKATSAHASQTDRMCWKLSQLIKFADASQTDKISQKLVWDVYMYSSIVCFIIEINVDYIVRFNWNVVKCSTLCTPKNEINEEQIVTSPTLIHKKVFVLVTWHCDWTKLDSKDSLVPLVYKSNKGVKITSSGTI